MMLLKIFLTVLIVVSGGKSFAVGAQQYQKAGVMARGKQVSFTILHTNDMHGTYMPFRTTSDNATSQTGDAGGDTIITFGKEAPIGGFAYLASAIKTIREAKRPDKVLLLDGGDNFSDDQLGNLTEGEAMIRLMNKVGYDFMALGNHDFDYGLERTRELEQLAQYPMRAANINMVDTGEPIFGKPYIIIEKSGVKLAILALGYRNTPQTSNPDNLKGLQFSNGLDATRKYLPELQEQANIIILLSHEGKAVDELIAREIKGIDLIIGGHSHDKISPQQKIQNTYIVQAMANGAVLGETELIISNQKLVEVKVNHHLLWHSEWKPDKEVQQLIEELRKPYLNELEEMVTEVQEVIGRQYKSESPFDKLVGNLLLESYPADVALLPGIGYGISLKGKVTNEEIYRLLPHPSKIVTLNLTGTQLKQTLEQSAENLKPDNPLNIVGGLLQTSRLQYEMDLTKPVGQRISHIKVADTPLEETKSYRVVTHNGMLKGLHRYDAIGQGKNVNQTEQGLTDFVIEKLKEKQVLRMPLNMGEATIKRKN